jgi:hypothetical protein
MTTNTFGDSGTTGSTSSIGATGAIFAMRFQSGSDAAGASATTMSWYIASSAGSNLKFALYSDSGTAPTNVLASASGSIGIETKWVTLTFGTPYTLAASTWYWFAVLGDADTTNIYYADSTSLNAGKDVTFTYASFPVNPFEGLTTTYTVRLYHAYVTYTLASSQTLIGRLLLTNHY